MQKSSSYSLRGHRRQGFKLCRAVSQSYGSPAWAAEEGENEYQLQPRTHLQGQGLWSVPSLMYVSQEVRLTSVLTELVPELT